MGPVAPLLNNSVLPFDVPVIPQTNVPYSYEQQNFNPFLDIVLDVGWCKKLLQRCHIPFSITSAALFLLYLCEYWRRTSASLAEEQISTVEQK